MSEEYDYGPWVDVPIGTLVQVRKKTYDNNLPHLGHPVPADSYRILTPKPRREFVVGKWYADKDGYWRKCIAIEGKAAWLLAERGDAAWPWTLDGLEPGSTRTTSDIDWSVPPRDEAPE